MKKLLGELILDSVQFSNFCQKVKQAYWKQSKGKLHLVEPDIDDILLLAWEEVEKLILFN